jgi:hypothetical protein
MVERLERPKLKERVESAQAARCPAVLGFERRRVSLLFLDFW